ncbi:MAG TPA: hypothetical protein VF101_13470 [Gaiellaceae bacterium]
MGNWKKKTPEEKALSEELTRMVEERIRNAPEIERRRREAEEERFRRIETRLDEVIELLRAGQAQSAERKAS